MLRALPFAALMLAACGPSLPELDSRLSPAARAADPPQLQPLGTLLTQAEMELPRSAEEEGRVLDARAEALRIRAARLQRTPL